MTNTVKIVIAVSALAVIGGVAAYLYYRSRPKIKPAEALHQESSSDEKKTVTDKIKDTGGARVNPYPQLKGQKS